MSLLVRSVKLTDRRPVFAHRSRRVKLGFHGNCEDILEQLSRHISRRQELTLNVNAHYCLLFTACSQTIENICIYNFLVVATALTWPKTWANQPGIIHSGLALGGSPILCIIEITITGTEVPRPAASLNNLAHPRSDSNKIATQSAAL